MSIKIRIEYLIEILWSIHRGIILFGIFLVASVMAIYEGFSLPSDNLAIALYLGAVASIIATIVFRIVDDYGESCTSHKRMIQIAKEFYDFAREYDFTYIVDYDAHMIELQEKTEELKCVYSSLPRKKYYHILAKDMFRAIKFLRERKLPEQIKDAIEILQKDILKCS